VRRAIKNPGIRLEYRDFSNFLEQNRNGSKATLEQFWNSCEILEHRPGIPGGFFMPFSAAEHPQYIPLPWPCFLR
jgi:hypothetical protein